MPVLSRQRQKINGLHTQQDTSTKAGTFFWNWSYREKTKLLFVMICTNSKFSQYMHNRPVELICQQGRTRMGGLLPSVNWAIFVVFDRVKWWDLATSSGRIIGKPKHLLAAVQSILSGFTWQHRRWKSPVALWTRWGSRGAAELDFCPLPWLYTS